MTAVEPEDAGASGRPDSLVDALGNPDWRARQVAIDRLARHDSPLLVSQLVEVVRREHRNLARLNAAIQVLTRIDLDVVPGLLPLLAHGDADVRAYVALALGDRGDVRAIPALIAALSDIDTNVRSHAIEALGKLQAAAAVDVLIQLVEELHFELAFPALDALAAIGDQRIAHRLLPLLQNPLLKNSAVEALGRLGDEEAVIPVLKLLSDSAVAPGTIASAVQQIHERYVSRYGSPVIAELVQGSDVPASVAAFRAAIQTSSTAELLAIIAIVGWLPGEEAEAILLDLLNRAELRRACQDALAARGPAIIPAVLECFNRSSRDSQLGLIELCGRVADRRAVPPLLECLGNDDEVVIQSLKALARIGDERLYASAKALLGHANPQIRQAAVAALNSLGHPKTAGDIQQLLKDPSAIVTESAVRVAAYFGFPECIDSVLACCDHSDERVRRTAVEHLACLDDERVVSRLEDALRSESPAVRAAAAGALGEVESRSSVDLLQRALDDSEVWVRYFAIRSLSQTNYPEAIRQKLLSLGTGDPAMQVRIAAIEALKAEDVEVLTHLACSSEEDLAIAAVKALGATGNSAALEALLLAARSGNPRLQTAAFRALGESGLEGAIPALLQAALGREQLLSEEAINALRRIRRPASVDALLEVAAIPQKRAAAISALTGLGQFGVPILAQRLHKLTLDVRRAVVEVLISIRSAEALGVLEAALADAEPAVRHSALRALAHVRYSRRQIPQPAGIEGSA